MNLDKITKKLKDKMGKKGYVYLVKFGNIYKIGSAINVNKRMSGLLVANPFLQLHTTIELLGFELVERILHKAFLSKKVAGEWFNLTEDDFKRIPKIIKETQLKIIKIKKYSVKDREHSIKEKNVILKGRCDSLQEENDLLREVVKSYDRLFKREFYGNNQAKKGSQENSGK